MSPRARLLAFVTATTVAACNGRDPLAPGDIAGTWISAWPTTTHLINIPDTLVFDGRGGGMMRALRWLEPEATGIPLQQVWVAGPVEYEIRRDDVFVRWCLQIPGKPPVTCTFDGFRMAGRLRRDGMLWIGPTDLASSLAATPWMRLSRDID